MKERKRKREREREREREKEKGKRKKEKLSHLKLLLDRSLSLNTMLKTSLKKIITKIKFFPLCLCWFSRINISINNSHRI